MGNNQNSIQPLIHPPRPIKHSKDLCHMPSINLGKADNFGSCSTNISSIGVQPNTSSIIFDSTISKLISRDLISPPSLQMMTLPDPTVLDYENATVESVSSKFRPTRIYFKNAIFECQTYDDQQVSGFGILKFKNGDIYEGSIKQGQLDGLGRYSFAGGQMHEGLFECSKYSGQGSQVMKNGDVFKGWFKEGRRCGRGLYVWSDSSSLESVFVDDVCHGLGDMRYADGTFYNGDYKENRRDGKGIYQNSRGVIFEGNWKDDKKQGNCRVTLPNKDTYKGYFVDDKMEGTFIVKTKEKIYQVIYKDSVEVVREEV